MLRVTLLLAMTMWGTSVFAQHKRVCASHEHNLELQSSDPEMKSRMHSIENHTRKFIKNRDESRINEDIISIPVVVHVIYNNDNQNISDAQILSQIEVLNEDFRKSNDNFSSTINEFKNIAADLQIEFCLSSVDPEGNITNGITRKYSERANWGTGSNVKYASEGGVDAWPTDQYLNMWVANIGGGILGYGQFPGGSKTTDGVVMSPQYFGSIEKEEAGEDFYLRAPFDLGRTTTHEVGHWLNLRHVWGDGGCGIDDLVEDTPISDRANYGCPTTHESCGTLDNAQNFMDYTDDVCMTMFTQGQKERARALFSEGGFRHALRSSNGCGVAIQNCEAPSNVSISNIVGTTAVVDFNEGLNASTYTIQLNASSEGWTIVSTTAQVSFELQNLSKCTNYELRVISNCRNAEDTSDVILFTTETEACRPVACETPTALEVTDQGGNTILGNVVIAWNEVEQAEAYEYELRVATLPFLRIVKRVSGDVNAISYAGLPKWWSYEVRVRSKCGNGLGHSEWTDYKEFTPGNNQSTTREADVSERFEYDKSSVFKVYPNPAKDNVNLKFGAELNNVDVKLIDMTGKVSRKSYTDMQSNGVLSIDLSDNAPGIYFLSVRSEEIELLTQKIVITK